MRRSAEEWQTFFEAELNDDERVEDAIDRLCGDCCWQCDRPLRWVGMASKLERRSGLSKIRLVCVNNACSEYWMRLAA